MKILLFIINRYLEFQKQVNTFNSLTKKRRRLTKIDLMKIANRYMMENGDLSFLDEPIKTIKDK